MKKVLIMALVIGFSLSISGISGIAEPTVSSIEITPTQPILDSEVTFSVDITGDDIEEVYIEVMECTFTPVYFCHPAPYLNISLDNIEGDTWEGTGTFLYDDTEEGHCWPVILDNGTWYNYKNDWSIVKNFTVLPAEEDGNGEVDGGDENGDSDGSPGFELIFLMISIIAVFFIYKRKRIK